MGTAAPEHNFTELKSSDVTQSQGWTHYCFWFSTQGEKILEYVNSKRSSGKGVMSPENRDPKEGNPALRVSSHRAQTHQEWPWKCPLELGNVGHRARTFLEVLEYT